MKKSKVTKIEYSSKRLGRLADEYYNEGKYTRALRFAYKQFEAYGISGEVCARLADIYEGMGLHSSAINWLYRYLDIAEEDELPDIYEALAVNYLNLGQEAPSAYYYNQLIDADDSLPEETKMDIATAFSKPKKSGLKFVYPPQMIDYSKEMNLGAQALKMGDCAGAIEQLSKVEKGSKDYVKAQEMQAIAKLLAGQTLEAEEICLSLLQDNPNDLKVLATLSAVYLEEGKKEESRLLAQRLYQMPQKTEEDLYKVATVCCENNMHEEAYLTFKKLEEKIPYDGRMLYFKGVSAYKSGRVDQAEQTFDRLCSIYPDAEVAKYYLRQIRHLKEGGTDENLKDLNYFYHIPQQERENRCRSLLHMSKCAKDEGMLFGLIGLHDGYFKWCFDEMDGTDHDLQYLGLIAGVHVGADEFLQEVFLDSEVLDLLKVEALRLIYLRNEASEWGIILYHIYKKVRTLPIQIGRKSRNLFLSGYAKIASKIAIIREEYGYHLQNSANKLYRNLQSQNALDFIDKEDDVASAIFLLSGIEELGKDAHTVVQKLGGNYEKVAQIIALATSEKTDNVKEKEDGTN